MVTKPELDPQILPWIERFERDMNAPDLDMPTRREAYARIMREQVHTGDAVDMRDITVPTRHGDMAARLYTPDASAPPLLIYMHGGGFVVGDLDTLDVPLTHIARESGWAILSLDYKLAPEYMYPVAFEQCEDGLLWALENTDALGVAPIFGIGGDSAGGNLTGLLTQKWADRIGDKLVWQLLINPVLDFLGVEEARNLSHRQFKDGPILSTDVMAGFQMAYFPDEDAKRIASPIHADLPERLPPAFIMAAECDPLRDDSIAYAKALTEKGFASRLTVLPGMCHNFITMTHVSDVARRALDEIAVEARKHNPTM